MKALLEKICSTYNLTNNDSAFEILSGVVIFKKSVAYIFSKNWLKIKIQSGKFSNDPNDGKIDLIDCFIDNQNETINLGFIQVENSESMSVDKIKLFVDSVQKYFIDYEVIDSTSNYKSLIPYQKMIKEKELVYSRYKINYYFYISYNGDINELSNSALASNVNDLNMSNTFFKAFDKNSIKEELMIVKNRINNPSDVSLNIKSNNRLIINDNEKFNSILMNLNTSEINKMIEEEQRVNIELNRLFNNNVRGFLNDSEVNQQIRETIEKYPNTFYYCNNGATIFCDSIEAQNKIKVHIVNPRILNGQQSIASMIKYDNSNKVDICVKLISSKNRCNKNREMNLICKTTNTSNPITPINLISNSSIVMKIKKKFSDNNINLSIKEGVLINNVFVDNDNIDLEEILKMWATLYIERPDYAKNYAKIVKIFYKSELDEKKYIVFQNAKVEDIVASQFLQSFLFFERIKDSLHYFENYEYYSHGKYVIAYIIYKDFGLEPVIGEKEIVIIKKKIEKNILEYKKDCEENNRSYSLNNYFKSSKPISDLNFSIKKETDYIEKLNNEISIECDENSSSIEEELVSCSCPNK